MHAALTLIPSLIDHLTAAIKQEIAAIRMGTMPITLFHRRQLDTSDDASLSFYDDVMREAALAAVNHDAISDRTPIIVTEQWDIDRQLTDISAKLRSEMDSARSAETYAREIDIFVRYLAKVRKKGISHLTATDVWAYRTYRTEGPLSVRVSNRTWNKITAVLLCLIAELGHKFPGVNWKKLRGSKDADTKVRMIELPKYVAFRDAFREVSRWSQRNAAFSEFLVTSGVRCSEGASLLKSELSDRGQFTTHRMIDLHLPATITKNNKARDVHFSRRVANDNIWPYFREERAHCAHVAIAKRFSKQTYTIGELARFSNDVFYEPDGRGKIRIVAGDLEKGPVATDMLLTEERKRLVEVERAGSASYRVVDLGPLWLTERGTAPCNASWRQAFSKASRNAFGDELAVSPHTLRHTYAVHFLSQLVKLLTSRPIRSIDVGEEIYRRIMGDPLRKLQTRLGHSDIATTYKYLTFLGDIQEELELALGDWEVASISFLDASTAE